MKYDRFTNETYNLYTIETDKFKSVHIEVVFRMPVTKENMTYSSLLTSMLIENCKNYPTKKLFARQLADLYNANINAVNSRVGGLLLSNFVMDILDPKYTDKETFEESIKMLFEVILNPNVKNDEFDEKTFERVKCDLAMEIDAIKEDPKQSSILKALKEIDSDDIRSMNASGDADILETITPKKLYQFYKEFLETSARDIYIVGNLDMKHVDKTIKKYAKFKSIIEDVDDIYLEPYTYKKAKTGYSDSKLSQTNLVKIYTLDGLSKRERDYVLPIYNMIWGSGSLESKLYKTLREENSLCYNVSSLYQKYDRNIIVHTAIDEENTLQAVKLIKKTLEDMQKGNIRNEDLESAKNMMSMSLNLILDSPNRLVDMYLFQNIAGLEDIETRIDEIKKVTIDDLITVGKKIKLIMTYRVRGE